MTEGMSPAKSSTSPRGAEAYLPARKSRAALVKAVDQCQGCELYEAATQAVFGSGSTSARIMLVGEQPGDREDREGEPFVGPAGRLLDRALAEAGIDPDDTYRTNAVKHFRHTEQGKRRMHQTPDLSHMVACSPWLEAELALVEPRGLVVLGASAGKAFYGSSFKLRSMRGGPHSWPANSRIAVEHPPEWLVVTTHPSAVLRAQDQRHQAFEEFVDDLRVVQEALKDSG
jgi:DNA polymerase